MAVEIFQSKRAALGLLLASLLSLGCTLLPAGNEGPEEPVPTTTSHGHSGKQGPLDAPAPTSSSPSTPPGGPVSVHLAMGIPTAADPSDDYLMVKSSYALGYSHRRNVPNWVGWNLNASYFGNAPRRKGKFLPDDTLPAGWYRVQDHDYTGSGYDRGHMVRSEERTRSPEDNDTTFRLTNVLPQFHEINAGPWLKLEDYCQELAQRESKELYLTAGGIFEASPPTIGHGVAVPSSCFKIVVVLERGQGLADVTAETRVIAVIMPNVKNILDQPWGQYRTSVGEVEKKTGHSFLTAVPAPLRKALKWRVDKGPTSGAR
jgi:endonuclease G